MKPTSFLLLMLFSALSSFNYSPLPAKHLPGVQSNNVQEFFSYLRCHRQAKNIVVNWGATSTTGIHHFVVYHSDDNDFFTPIGEIFPDGSLKYTYKHEDVFPGYHYYYIQAVMNAGPPVNSIVDVVRIVKHG